MEAIRGRLAANFGCASEEMAITRNTSESLEICQFGLELKRGDEVLTEASTGGDDFLATVCRDWEAATGPAEAPTCRCACRSRSRRSAQASRRRSA